MRIFPSEHSHTALCNLFPLAVLVQQSQLCVLMQVVANLILDAVIAGLAAALSGAFIIPSLAGDDLRSNIAATLRGLGQSVSGCAAQFVARIA